MNRLKSEYVNFWDICDLEKIKPNQLRKLIKSGRVVVSGDEINLESVLQWKRQNSLKRYVVIFYDYKVKKWFLKTNDSVYIHRHRLLDKVGVLRTGKEVKIEVNLGRLKYGEQND